MEYKNDWKFEKFSRNIKKDSHKERVYELYKQLSKEATKRLFLYLEFEDSRNEIIYLLESSKGLLTLHGLTNHLFGTKKLFQEMMEFECTNNNCDIYGNNIKSTKFMYKKCPKCSEGIRFINKDEMFNTFYALYLNYFDFYLLNDVEKTMYVIRNKFNGKYYLKASDDSFANWLHLKLLENNCDIKKYLMSENGCNIKNSKTSLFNMIKDYSLIKLIDNINFKPVRLSLFEEEDKKYFNLYRGNKCLNAKYEKEEGINYLDKCPNILELLNNLTGKDEEGVEYLIDVLAMILQEPHIKTKQLIVFYGEEAAGKGTFYDLILKPLFDGYITKILGKKIKSTFNSFMSQNLVLVLEEVKADKDEEDTLKELVTEDTLVINQKNMPEREENNYLTIFGFSNEQNPISAGKRRGVYFRSRTLGGTTNKAPTFRKKYEKKIPKEFEYFIKELKTRQYNRVEIMKGYETEAKKQVLAQNMSVIERFYDELCNYKGIGSYVSQLIESRELDINYDMSKYIHRYHETNYVQAEFMLLLYNTYLKKNKYNSITLNKFGEFWQLIKIDRDNKEHWRRLINPVNDKKTFYVNIDLLNKEVLKKYEEE